MLLVITLWFKPIRRFMNIEACLYNVLTDIL